MNSPRLSTALHAVLLAWAASSWDKLTRFDRRMQIYGQRLAGQDQRWLASYYILVTYVVMRALKPKFSLQPRSLHPLSFLSSLLLLPGPMLLDEVVHLQLLHSANMRLKRLRLIGRGVPQEQQVSLKCSICQDTSSSSSSSSSEQVPDPSPGHLENFCHNVPSHVLHPSCLLPWWLAVGPTRASCPECRGSLRVKVKLQRKSNSNHNHSQSIVHDVRDWFGEARQRLQGRESEVIIRIARSGIWLAAVWLWMLVAYAGRWLNARRNSTAKV